MDSIIVASEASVFSLFGWGFLAGSLFGFGAITTFEFISGFARKQIKVKH